VKAASPHTPVLMLTGWGQQLRTSGELPPDVDALLSKPPKLAALRSALVAVTARPQQGRNNDPT